MKLKFSIAAFTLILTVQSFFVFAQEKGIGAPGTEKPLFQKTDKSTGNSCYVYKQYVVTTSSSEDVGENIQIFKRSGSNDFKKDCANTKGQAYMTLPNDDANYFFGLTGDKFFVDSGTGAGIRGLDVASLTSKKVIYSTTYDGDVKVAGNVLFYDKPTEDKGALKSCPNAQKWEKQGGSVGWVRPARLDLTTLKETFAGNIKCVYVE